MTPGRWDYEQNPRFLISRWQQDPKEQSWVPLKMSTYAWAKSWNGVNKAPIRKQGRSRWFGEVGYISEKDHFEPGFGTSRLFETICARNHLKMSDITASGGTQPLSWHPIMWTRPHWRPCSVSRFVVDTVELASHLLLDVLGSC